LHQGLEIQAAAADELGFHTQADIARQAQKPIPADATPQKLWELYNECASYYKFLRTKNKTRRYRLSKTRENEGEGMREKLVILKY